MRIGVFCSGGDAPGMNACIRAVVRAAGSRGHEVVGIRRGYQGLLDQEFYRDVDGSSLMSLRSVSGISQRGGTILGSSRSDEFRSEAGQKKAARILKEHGIEGLVAIGGDGTFRGASALARHWDGLIVGCPGTIDNDLIGSDYTIGFSTAVQTAMQAVDKVRDTAESHDRMFLIEVMGRHSGYIGVHTALASAAEVVCIPETDTNIPEIVAQLKAMRLRGKTSVMLVVAEGDERGGAAEIQQKLADAGCPYPMRSIVLGHLLRGGSPTAEDRILASRTGDFAVRLILEGQTGVMAGVVGEADNATPFEKTVAHHREIPLTLLDLLETLAS